MCGEGEAHCCGVGITLTPLVIGFFFFNWRITALQCCVGSAGPD